MTCVVYLLLSFVLPNINVMSFIRLANRSQEHVVSEAPANNIVRYPYNYSETLPNHHNSVYRTIHTSSADISNSNYNRTDIKHVKEVHRNYDGHNVENRSVLYGMEIPVSVRLGLPEVECNSGRFLVYKCVSMCGGMGDREKGIISAFLLALLTNRTFVIDMPKPCALTKLLHSNLYDWQKCGHVARTKDLKLLKYIDLRGKQFMDSIPQTKFDAIWKDDVVVIQMNVNIVDKVREHRLAKTRIPWLHNHTREEIIGFVLGILFRVDDRIFQRFEDFKRVYLEERTLVCAHIRSGRNPSIPKDTRLRDGAPNEDTILAFLQTFNDTNKHVIYLATDSERIRKKSRERISNIQMDSRPIIHVDRTNVSETMACEGFETVVQEQFLLSRCDVLILTRSGLGAMAAYMRGHPDNLFIYSTKRNTIVKATNLSEIQSKYGFL